MKKENLSRITIDIPENDHKQFKALAALKGTTMRDLVVEAIKNHLEEERKLEGKQKIS